MTQIYTIRQLWKPTVLFLGNVRICRFSERHVLPPCRQFPTDSKTRYSGIFAAI